MRRLRHAAYVGAAAGRRANMRRAAAERGVILLAHINSQEEKLHYMTEQPIPRLVGTLAVPTIISMLVTSIYNMADTFFVGRIGTSATGAVGVVFSLMAVIQAVGFTFGNGSGNYISRLLGARQEELASKVAATGFISALLFGVVFSTLGLIFLDSLVSILGATPTILPYARDYARYILIGAPYMMASLVLNNLLRFQGNAFWGMIGITAGGVLNIALDPIFIFVLDMGTGGAALATIISQFISFCILLHNCGKGGSLRIRLRDFAPSKEMYYQILRGGLPSFYRQGIASVSTIVLNLAAGPFGDAAIAAMSVVNRVTQFANSAMIGFGQGFQPVCGFNYGAKRYDRVYEAFWFCVRVAVVGLALVGITGLIFAPEVIAIFRRDDMQVIEIGAKALRFQACTLPFMSWVTMSNMMLQTIGRTSRASFLALARQGLFLIPALLILPNFLGVLGVQMGQTVADTITLLVAIPMSWGVLVELKNQPSEQPGGEAVVQAP